MTADKESWICVCLCLFTLTTFWIMGNLASRSIDKQTDRQVGAIQNANIRATIVDSRETKEAVADVISAATESIIREEITPRPWYAASQRGRCVFCGDLIAE